MAEVFESVAFEAGADDTKEFTEITASGWLLDGPLVDDEEEDRKEEVDDAREQVSQPVANILLRVCSGYLEECSNVDETVVCQSQLLGTDFGILNDPLAALQSFDDETMLGVLIKDDWEQVGFE